MAASRFVPSRIACLFTVLCCHIAVASNTEGSRPIPSSDTNTLMQVSLARVDLMKEVAKPIASLFNQFASGSKEKKEDTAKATTTEEWTEEEEPAPAPAPAKTTTEEPSEEEPAPAPAPASSEEEPAPAPAPASSEEEPAPAPAPAPAKKTTTEAPAKEEPAPAPAPAKKKKAKKTKKAAATTTAPEEEEEESPATTTAAEEEEEATTDTEEETEVEKTTAGPEPKYKISPFGKEDTARELQKHASRTQDTLVDAIENAEVAEIKRSVFRALTRLRAAEIKEFDTIARLETQAIDEYNDNHHFRKENPLDYLHAPEPKVTEDKYTSFHD